MGGVFNSINLDAYQYCGQNPVKFVDPDGNDFILLNDSDAAFGYGHNAILVGNDIDGWVYYSKDGGDDNNIRIEFDTLEEFQNSEVSERYDRGYYVSTTKDQDKLMQEYGDQNFNRTYSVKRKEDRSNNQISENCADLTQGIMLNGGVSIERETDKNIFVGGEFTSPNKQFEALQQNGQGRDLIPHNNEN